MHMQRRPSAAAGALAVLLGHIHPVRCAADSLKLELGAIGHTSMADLTGFLSHSAVSAGVTLFAKKEFENPGLSHKDRIAKGIIDAAAARGEMVSVSASGETVRKTVVAASSGNTGNSIAWVARQKGFAVVIITNRKCSDEKQNDIRSKGAQLLISEDLYELSLVADGADGKSRVITAAEVASLPEQTRMDLAKCTITETIARKLGWHTPGAIYPQYTSDYMKIETIMAEDPVYYSVRQYDNLDNYQAHYDTLAAELYRNGDGGRPLTDFVFTGSTGGTITGVGTFLKEQDPSIKVILADPEGSRLRYYLEGGRGADQVVENYKKTKVEGAGKESSTSIFEAKKRMKSGAWVIEKDAMVVPDPHTVLMMHRLKLQAGLWVGASSGVNVQAAVDYADRLVASGLRDRKIVTVLCDPGYKYESKFYNDEWLAKNGLPLFSASQRLFDYGVVLEGRGREEL